MTEPLRTRPWIPLLAAVAGLLLSSAISTIILRYFPLPQVGLLAALLSGQARETVCLAVVWWLILLRPHTRASAAVPIALIAVPYLLPLIVQAWGSSWLHALDAFAFGMNYLSSHLLGTSVAFYIASRWCGWQLVRRGDRPAFKRLSLAGIFSVTTLAALVLAGQQFVKHFQIATLQSDRLARFVEVSALLGSLLALVTMVLLTWSYALRSVRLVALALTIAIAFDLLFNKLIAEPLMRALIADLPGGSVQIDWATVYVSTLTSNLLFLLAIVVIESGGYRLVQVRSAEAVDSQRLRSDQIEHIEDHRDLGSTTKLR